MSKFKKTRQLIQMVIPNPGEKIRMEFIEVPGYLYRCKKYKEDMFVHHKVVFNKAKRCYQMQPSWIVSELRTGLSIDARDNYNTRGVAVAMAEARIAEVTKEQYYEAVFLGMAKAPERKPQWSFPTVKSAAVKVGGQHDTGDP